MGFMYNEISSDSMGIKTRMSTENRIPDIRNLTDKIAGKNGIFDFGETFSEREINIACFIPPGKTDKELQSVKDKINEWLNPENGVKPLILDVAPDRLYYARLKDGFSYERIVRNTGTFELTFFCPDPFAYAVDDEVFSITHSANITRNKGNYESAPLYQITGLLLDDSESIRISINGESMEVVGPLLNGETMVIDADNMTAKIVDGFGNTRNALGQMKTLEFPHLKADSNSITIGVTKGSLSLLKINANSRWL
jgi:predicted phage tail component-like protein